MSLYSLSVLRVSIAERDSVARIVASEEKPIKAANQHRDYRNNKIHEKTWWKLFGASDDIVNVYN